jgi:hypothetical protein
VESLVCYPEGALSCVANAGMPWRRFNNSRSSHHKETKFNFNFNFNFKVIDVNSSVVEVTFTAG